MYTEAWKLLCARPYVALWFYSQRGEVVVVVEDEGLDSDVFTEVVVRYECAQKKKDVQL